jgi:hypothetical protein
MIQPSTSEHEHHLFWFIAVESQQKGPYTIEQINELIIQGAVSRSTLVWTKRMPQWAKANSTDLANLFDEAPKRSVKYSNIDTNRKGNNTLEIKPTQSFGSPDKSNQYHANSSFVGNGNDDLTDLKIKHSLPHKWWARFSPVTKLFLILTGSYTVFIGFIALTNLSTYGVIGLKHLGRVFGAYAPPCILIAFVSGIAHLLKRRINHGVQYMLVGILGLCLTLLSVLGNSGGLSLKSLSDMWAPLIVGGVILSRAFMTNRTYNKMGT